MPECLIALGGNLGDVRATFRAAGEQLARTGGIQLHRVSRPFVTPPVGDAAGGTFVNAAARITTSLTPLELLDVLQAIETDLGRTRDIHWGPRTLDLDIVLYGQTSIRSPRLHVPHTACWYRRFVLDPVVEIAGDVTHPELGLSFGALRERLLPRPLPVVLLGEPAAVAEVTRRLAPKYPDVGFVSRLCGGDSGLQIDFAETDPREASPAALVVGVPAGLLETRTQFVRHVLDSAVATPVADAATAF